MAVAGSELRLRALRSLVRAHRSSNGELRRAPRAYPRASSTSSADRPSLALHLSLGQPRPCTPVYS